MEKKKIASGILYIVFFVLALLLSFQLIEPSVIPYRGDRSNVKLDTFGLPAGPLNFMKHHPHDIDQKISTLFPIGTKREVVRSVMRSSNATTAKEPFQEHQRDDLHGYTEAKYPNRSHVYLFSYNESDELIGIYGAIDKSLSLTRQ